MSIISARFVVPKATPYTAPYVFLAGTQESFCESIAIFTDKGALVDSGIIVSIAEGTIYPTLGVSDASAPFDGHGIYGAIPATQFPVWMPININMGGPNYQFKLSVYNESAANDIIVVFLAKMTTQNFGQDVATLLWKIYEQTRKEIK